MSSGARRNQVSADNIVDSDDLDEEEIQEDQCIVFLDAASDSNFENLKSVYEKVVSQINKKRLLTFQDGDCNTALHFGAKNGNVKICNLILEESMSLGIA